MPGGGEGEGGVRDRVGGRDDTRTVSFSWSRSRVRVVDDVEVETSRADAEAEGCDDSKGARNDRADLERVRIDGSSLSLSLTV